MNRVAILSALCSAAVLTPPLLGQAPTDVNVAGGAAAFGSFAASRIITAAGGVIGSPLPSTIAGKQPVPGPPGTTPLPTPGNPTVATAIVSIGQFLSGTALQQGTTTVGNASKIVTNYVDNVQKAPTAPLLYAIESAEPGHAAGPKLVGRAGKPEKVRLFGANLIPSRDTGTAHSTRVFFGTEQATVLEAESSSTIVVETPPGFNAFDNPLGTVSIRLEQTSGGTTKTTFFPDAYVFGPAIYNKTISLNPPLQGVTLYHVADATVLVFGGCDLGQPFNPQPAASANGNLTLISSAQIGSANLATGSASDAALEVPLIAAVLFNSGIPNLPCPPPSVPTGLLYKYSFQALVIDNTPEHGVSRAQWTVARTIEIQY